MESMMDGKDTRKKEQWYYRDGETPVGPFDLEGLEKLFNAGMINDSTLIRHGQSRQWTEYAALNDDTTEHTDETSHLTDELSFSTQGSQTENRTTHESTISEQNEGLGNNQQIDTTQPSINHWPLEPVTPWRRYGARILDLSLNGVFGWFIIGTSFYQLAPVSADRFFASMNPVMDILLTVLVGIVITGILIGFSGSSIGKWVFGIRVTDVEGRPIGVIAGIIRDLSVWIKGLGFGLPIISLITMYLSYQRLKEKGTTSWDESGNYRVSHRPSGPFQYVLNIIGIMLILFINAFVRSLEQI